MIKENTIVDIPIVSNNLDFHLDHEFNFLSESNKINKFIDYLSDFNQYDLSNIEYLRITHYHECFFISNWDDIPESNKEKLNILLEKLKLKGLILRDNNLNKNITFNKNVIHQGYPFFLGMTTPYSLTINKPLFKTKFICLNARQKFHRDEIVKFLYKSNIYKNSILSHENYSDKDLKSISVSLDSNDFILKNIWGTSAYRPLKINYTSFCNIVTETNYDKHNLEFISEKTEKCFSAAQPFVLVSTPNSLKKLREFGFKTFSDWWDESYDDEVDDYKRMKKIQDTIKYINSMSNDELHSIYQEMIPILQENQFTNYQWYLKNLKNSEDEHVDEFEDSNKIKKPLL